MLTLDNLTLDKMGINYHIKHNIDDIVLEILKTIEKANSKPSKAAWNDYWQTLDSPTHPSYLMRTKTFRYKGNYIIADNDTEVKFYANLKKHYFTKYFSNLDQIAEFGCGSGNNLIQYSELFPNTSMHAFDWSEAAVKLVQKFAKAEVFDMTAPTPVTLGPSAGVFTCGSLEQLGDNFKPFLKFLISLNAKIYMHIEPFVELYDPNLLFDYLAIMYHKKRDYLGNYLTCLTNTATIIEQNRTGFGNLYNEGYMVVVWQPQPT